MDLNFHQLVQELDKNVISFLTVYLRGRIAALYAHQKKLTAEKLEFSDLLIMRESRIWKDPIIELDRMILNEISFQESNQEKKT